MPDLPTPLMPSQTDAARVATEALLDQRAPGGSICPSEVARVLAADETARFAVWRDAMPTVHLTIDKLVAEGTVRLSWKGAPLTARAGPYRISRAG